MKARELGELLLARHDIALPAQLDPALVQAARSRQLLPVLSLVCQDATAG